MTDVFRPRHDPARCIYDAFQEAAKKRSALDGPWIKREQVAVWKAARDYAQQHGLRVPTVKEVVVAERQAEGHIDYGAKWAYAIAYLMQHRSEVTDEG